MIYICSFIYIIIYTSSKKNVYSVVDLLFLWFYVKAYNLALESQGKLESSYFSSIFSEILGFISISMQWQYQVYIKIYNSWLFIEQFLFFLSFLLKIWRLKLPLLRNRNFILHWFSLQNHWRFFFFIY